MTNLSITTDYIQSVGDPFPYICRISDSGFTHIHWCHHWNSDHLYSEDEINQIKKWLFTSKLGLNDLHSTEGIDKYWISPKEDRQIAGIKLVKNRINMASILGSDVIIQHIQREPNDEKDNQKFWDRVRYSLDQLKLYAGRRGVRIAFENLTENLNTLIEVMSLYPPEFVGLCFDTGHANMVPGQLEKLYSYKDRLISIHLHDNDGLNDQHKIPFTGSITWDIVTKFIAGSSYDKCVNLEVVIHESGFDDEIQFLDKLIASGEILSQMINEHRQAN
jgi:sugar phosphate isomerase/epimerase